MQSLTVFPVGDGEVAELVEFDTSLTVRRLRSCGRGSNSWLSCLLSCLVTATSDEHNRADFSATAFACRVTHAY